MGYYTRVFCNSNQKPKISEIIESLKSNNYDVSVDNIETEQNSDDWTCFELTYSKGISPLLIELDQKGKPDAITEEEIEEFIEYIGKPKFYELSKKRVIKHLKLTEFIVSIQLATSDFIDLGYDVNGDLMEFIADNFSGIVQADGEGFYKNDKLILKLE